MAVIVRTASYTMALPMVWPVFARRMLSAMTAYMWSLAALSAAPSTPKSLSSLICMFKTINQQLSVREVPQANHSIQCGLPRIHFMINCKMTLVARLMNWQSSPGCQPSALTEHWRSHLCGPWRKRDHWRRMCLKHDSLIGRQGTDV